MKERRTQAHYDKFPLIACLISIFIDESPVIFLEDTGSEVNKVSNTQIEQIGYNFKIKPTKFRCCGPSGEPLSATREVYLDFSLGNRLYTAKFIVLELHSKTARIFGYHFMKSNNIIIHCGKTITNIIHPILHI